jgi:hypothetical protein
MTRFARSVSSLSRTGPFGSVAHMVLMQSRVRDNELTTANIGSMDGGAASGSATASDFGPRNSITFCIVNSKPEQPVTHGPVASASFCTGASGGLHHSDAWRRLA